MNEQIVPPSQIGAIRKVRRWNATRLIARHVAWLKHPFVIGSSALAVAQYAAAGIGLGATVLAARELGPEGFGAASLAIAYPSMIWAFSTAKPITVATRYLSRFRATKEVGPFVAVCQVSYCLDIAAAAVAMAIVALTATWISSSFYGLPNLAGVMIAYAAFFPLASLSGTSQAILTSAGRFQALAALRLLRAVLLLALTAASIVFDAGLFGYVIAVAASQVTTALFESVAALTLIRRELGVLLRDLMRSRLSELVTLKRELQSLYVWSYVLTTVMSLGDHGLLLLLGAYAGPSESGYFRLATTLMAAARITEVSMAKVVYPRLAAEWSGGAYADVIRAKLSRWTWRAGVPAALLVTAALFLLPVLIPILFGNMYAPMIFGTQLMFAALTIRVLVFWLEPSFYAAGAVKVWTRFHLAQVTLVLAAGGFLIAHFGFFGAAIAVTVGTAIVPIIAVGWAVHSEIIYENKSDRCVRHA